VSEQAMPIFRGWKEISQALEVDEDTAVSYAARAYDPLPVRYDHARRVWIYQAALGAWVHRQDLPYHAFHVLDAAGKLPGQIKGPVAVPAVTRTKVAKRRRAATERLAR
jgi:hypothetical protein